ncbi:MAG: YbaY family lipoprotein [Actinomycetota bacterium]
MTDQPALGSVRRVRGEVILPEGSPPTGVAQLIVQVEDVSRADAPSKVVGELRIARPVLREGKAVPFEVEVSEEQVDPSASYSVRAHVDFSGSGEIESGDLLSTQSYPVLTHGYPEQISVEVKKI